MAIAAMKAGANVLVEKPLAGTLQEVDAIQLTEQATGKFVAVGFQDIYASLTHRVKKVLLDGELGQIHAIKGWGMWPREQSYFTRNNWAGRLKQGSTWVLDSPLNNAMAHFLNVMLFLMGDSQYTSAKPLELQGELYRSKPIESFDTAGLRLRLSHDRALTFLSTHSSQVNRDPEIHIVGEKGTLVWHFWNSCRIQFNDGSEQLLTVQAQEAVLTEMMLAVLNKIENPAGFVCSTALARMHTLVINALHDHVVIQTVDDAFIEEIPTQNSTIITIRGIEGDFTAAFLDGKLPSEQGCLWGRKSVPPIVGIQNYAAFNNCGFC
ncbi:MAG: Gfo/Idh/MocA family oxidoreductase [Verrucomicrobia bacterium]|nr:Gfo/Idh/MocA family oxidoreductase [Verrucomicrobiota bacterium]